MCKNMQLQFSEMEYSVFYKQLSFFWFEFFKNWTVYFNGISIQ